MENFKVGDYVRYIAHYSENYAVEIEDKKHFNIGEIYKIVAMSESSFTRKQFPFLEVKNYGMKQVSHKQIEKILDCKLNRLLYPEAFKNEVQDD